MRRQLFAALMVAFFVINSCSNDFDLVAPWQDIPVVYAMLSPNDDVHYVRVERAFADPKISALEIVKNPDSVYYREDQIAVYLETEGKRYPMQRVDAASEGIVRDEGIFPSVPNILYKLNNNAIPGGLKAGKVVRVVVERADGKPSVTAQTIAPDRLDLRSPNPNPAFPPPMVNFAERNATTFDWRTDSNGVFFTVKMIVRYREQIPGVGVQNREPVIWTAFSNVARDPNNLVGDPNNFRGLTTVSGKSFFEFLLDKLGPRNDTIRYFNTCSFVIEGGGKEIQALKASIAAVSGLTGAEITPLYSNVSGGYGIVTAKSFAVYDGFFVGGMTVDSMNNSDIYKRLNFRK